MEYLHTHNEISGDGAQAQTQYLVMFYIFLVHTGEKQLCALFSMCPCFGYDLSDEVRGGFFYL